MKRTCLRILSFIIMSMLGACSSDPYLINCTDGPVLFTFLEAIRSMQLQNVEITNGSAYVVIRSQEEYINYVVPGSSLPVVDFKRNTLLLSQSYSNSVPVIVQQQITSNCDRSTIDYLIQLRKAGPATPGTAYSAVTIPKISAQTRVNFVINYVD